MQLTLKEVVISFLCAFIVSALLTPLFKKLAIASGIVDRPNQGHKTHTQPVPYLGGMSIVATVIIGLFFVLVLRNDSPSTHKEIVILMCAPIVLAIVGLFDDVKNLGANSRLVFQTSSATVIALIFRELGWYGEPTSVDATNVLISIFWIVGITNSFNFIDNLDGGAGGIALISALTLSAGAIIGEQLALASISTLVAGATLGFLIWNLYPARIYLGDSGALFIGSILAILTIRLDPETSSPFSGWFFALLLFAVPILDTSVAVISRVLRGISPLQGGKDHLSHRLLNFGFSRKLSAVSIWLLQVYFSLLGLLLFVTNQRGSIIVELLASVSWIFFLGLFLRLSPMIAQTDRDYK